MIGGWRTHATRDNLPSWNDGAAKTAILGFLARVPSSWRPPRMATFDNDGTLWCEQPIQAQLFFLVDRVMQLAANPRLGSAHVCE
jgi:hypothetical protein